MRALFSIKRTQLLRLRGKISICILQYQFTVVSILLQHLKSFHIFTFVICRYTLINIFFLVNKCYQLCTYISIFNFSICEYLKCTYLVIQPVYHKAIYPLFKVVHGIRHRKDSREWSLAKVMRSSLLEWMCMILNSQY